MTTKGQHRKILRVRKPFCILIEVVVTRAYDLSKLIKLYVKNKFYCIKIFLKTILFSEIVLIKVKLFTFK